MAACAALVLAPLARGRAVQPGAPPPDLVSTAAERTPWHDAPEYIALLAPRSLRSAYRAFISPAGLDQVLRQIAADPATAALSTASSWRVGDENPFDAFGAGGTYDRWKLARLYGSRRPRVARGPRGSPDRVEESWTLISPYPSARLDALHPGTLLLVVRVP